MRAILKTFFVLAILGGVVALAYQPITAYLAQRNKITWRTSRVERGSIIAVVNSTGTIKPKLQVTVGSFVSGPIDELNCEFNQEVKKGDILAKIDPRIYQAGVDRDQATIASREADVFRVQAQLQQAINDEKRAIALRAEDDTFIAQAEMDKIMFSRISLEAQLKVAQTSIDQAKATLENSLLQLGYTEIKAPVDGIVIDRKIDPGQTLAAQFQTPELFVIAPDMREEMHVHASVDEADIGQIQVAKAKNYPVTFTVDAYPDELFTGKVNEVRLSSTTLQNVVTYPVIVGAPNPDLKLLPGMTASISFQVDERQAVIKIPNGALRFYPDAKYVRAEDIPLLEGLAQVQPVEADAINDTGDSIVSQSARDRTDSRKRRSQRHVWVAEDQKLRAVAVTVGLSDGQFTELVSGELKDEQELVIGIQTQTPGTPR